MLHDILLVGGGAAGGIVVTALALHLSRKNTIKTVEAYAEAHAKALWNRLSGGNAGAAQKVG